MNNYEICTLIIKLFSFFGVAMAISFIVTIICIIRESRYCEPSPVAEIIGVISIILCICCFVITTGLGIGYGINKQKCQMIIKNKVEMEYGDYTLISPNYNSNSNINDPFEFISDGMTYEAYYDADQDAIIVQKLNFKGVQKIENVFGK